MTEFIQQVVYGISGGMNLALVAVGLTLIFGVYKTLNLAHGQIFMFGAFVTYFLSTEHGVPFYAALVLSMIAMGLAGVLMEGLVFRPLRRRPLTDQLLASLGLFLAIGTIALHIWGDFQSREIRMPGEDSAVTVGGVRFDVARLEIIGGTIVLFALLYLLVYRTHIGRMMRAMAQDEEAAALMGVRVNVVASATFFVGSALGGGAGAFLGALFNAKWDMGFQPLLLALVIIIFGGLGSIAGSIVAALIIGIMTTISIYYISPTLADLLPFSVLLLVLLVRPRGLFGLHVSRA